MSTSPTRPVAGRPEVTSHGEIERVAFRLFVERGFASTTLDEIARAVGVSRRTLFRYFPSKNDIPWGRFDRTLESFRALLEAMPTDLPLHEAVHRGVIAFNDFPDDAQPSHRQRMRLILSTPELQAHSVLRYADWRQVIAEYVAQRTVHDPAHLLPQTVAQVSLSLALSAYDAWLADETADLAALLGEVMTILRSHVLET